MVSYSFFDRDLSWLSFNGRILQEAAREDVPLMERVNFLAIFSSNLDEFYRVRMPVLFALDKLQLKEISVGVDVAEDQLQIAQRQIRQQQEQYGQIFTGHIIPLLKEHHIHLLFNEALPQALTHQLNDYFF